MSKKKRDPLARARIPARCSGSCQPTARSVSRAWISPAAATSWPLRCPTPTPSCCFGGGRRTVRRCALPDDRRRRADRVPPRCLVLAGERRRAARGGASGQAGSRSMPGTAPTGVTARRRRLRSAAHSPGSPSRTPSHSCRPTKATSRRAASSAGNDLRYFADLGRAAHFRRYAGFPAQAQDIFHPDGLAFSGCGGWLAVADHGKQTVAIFRRDDARSAADALASTGSRPRSSPIPASAIRTPSPSRPTRPSPRDQCGPILCAYAPVRGWFGRSGWSQTPAAQVMVHDDDAFREVNTADKMEGRPKGIAIHGNTVAVCSPQIGVKIYAFREGWR